MASRRPIAWLRFFRSGEANHHWCCAVLGNMHAVCRWRAVFARSSGVQGQHNGRRYGKDLANGLDMNAVHVPPSGSHGIRTPATESRPLLRKLLPALTGALLLTALLPGIA